MPDTKGPEGGQKAAKDAADVTEVPSGLDVAVTVPGTYVGAHDLQGTDGTERTDRPGEILGTPAEHPDTSAVRGAAREIEAAKADYVTAEVDRANREELPRLGGPTADAWQPEESDTRATAEDFRTRTAEARQVMTTQRAAAQPADSGIRVKPGVERS